jgi:hypothetical protein
VDADSLNYEIEMAMDQVPMIFHISGQLRRAG